MKQKRQQPMGAKAVRGSDAARRQAALLLEAWSGVRTTQSASEAMGVAVTRFYQLEARALQMLVSAMEPRSRGRQTSPANELVKLKAEKQRLVRDVERFQRASVGHPEEQVARGGEGPARAVRPFYLNDIARLN